MKKLKDEEVLEENENKPKKTIRGSWFSFILYPQDNDQNFHRNVLEYIQECPLLFDKWLYVTHNRDKNENGDLIKSHVHLLFHTTEPYTRHGLEKFFAMQVDLSKIEIIHNYKSYVLYMAHQTYASDCDGKEKYNYDEFYGTPQLKSLLRQNSSFVEKSLIQDIKEKRYIVDVLEECSDVEFEEIKKHAGFYLGISNQQIRRMKENKPSELVRIVNKMFDFHTGECKQIYSYDIDTNEYRSLLKLEEKQ